MSAALTVRRIEELDYDQWRRFVASSSSGSVYALPEYLEILCGATGGRFEILGVYRGSELAGGMPLYLARTRGGWLATDRELLAYHGPVLKDYPTKYPSERIARCLAALAALEGALRAFPCLHMVLYFRHTVEDVRPFIAGGWRVLPDYSHIVPIADLPATWGRIDRNIRRLVDRAAKHGLVCTEDGDVASLYRLHREVRRRKGTPLYLPEKAFDVYVNRLRERNLCRLYHARLPDGTVAASQLVLTGPHPVCHTVCCGSDVRFLSLGATPFLRWRAFRALSEAGYAACDLTGAPLNDVTRFKRQLGGDLVANWWVIRPETARYRLYDATRGIIRCVRRTAYRIRRWPAGL